MEKRIQRRPIGPPALKPTDLRAAQAEQGRPRDADADHVSPEQRAWQTMLDLSEPLLANHRVQGANVLPGAVYIDLFYQALVQWGWALQRIELRDLTIHNPQTVGAGQRYRIRVEVVAQRQTVLDLRITSQREDGDATPVRLASVTAVPVDAQDLPPSAQLIDVLRQVPGRPIADSYRHCESQGLVHAGVMQATGRACRLDGQVLLQLAAAHAEPDAYLIDPVLLDAMGVALSPYLLELLGERDSLFLPLMYGRFYAAAPLRQACYASIDLSGVRPSEDLLRCSVRLFSEAGTPVALLTDFTCKRVRPGQVVAAPPRNGATAGTESRGVAVALPAAAPEALVRLVQSLVADELGGDAAEVALDAGYYALGLNSSSLLVIVEKLKTRLGLPLSPTLFFEYTTIAALAAHLLEAHPALRQEGMSAQAGSADEAHRPAGAHAGTPVHGAAAADARPAGPAGPASAASLRDEPLAIIGMAGRFPQAADVEAFWQNLLQGRDVVTEVPADRWDWETVRHIPLPSGKPVSRWGGFIDAVDAFDPLFFRIAPREAEAMDPQERLFLDVCWEAIENAGYVPDRLAGAARAVGVYVGVMHKDYSFVGAEVLARGDTRTPLSLNYAAIANRVSYCFDFRGPSITFDTVCSASLTAVHFACESLRSGDCEVAIAGGVNLSLHPNKYISYGLMGLHSSDGRCRSFGQGGDGYVSAEAVAGVVLKPLRHALRDGDGIYATILATGVNHVGNGSGITVPDPVAQSELMLRCLKRAGIHPGTIGYVETHGTGTSLGDPIEIRALARVFAAFPAAGTPARCALGSVKSNLGHAEAAAGITGLIKAVLQLHHGRLVPSIHCDPVNPYLALESTPFHLQRVLEPWPAPPAHPRRSAVNSIGATGSNAFVLLEGAAPAAAPRVATPLPVLLPLSAGDPQRLDDYARAVLGWLERNPAGIDLPSLAFTLQHGRLPMKARLCLVASSLDQAIVLLKQALDGPFPTQQAASGVVAARQRPAAGSATVAAGDDSARRVGEWAATGDYLSLARHWCSGEALAWEQLPATFAGSAHSVQTPPRRIALPGAARMPQRFWIGGARGPAPTVAAQRPVPPGAARSAGNPLLLVPTWEPAGVAARADAAARRPYLVLGHESDLAPLATTVGERHAGVTFDESIEQLLQKITLAGAPDSLLLLLGASGGRFPDDVPQRLASTVGFAFRLAKALLRAGYAGRSLDWTVVTRGAVQADTDAAPDPVQAALHGLIGVVAKEQPRWRVRVLDLSADARAEDVLGTSCDVPSGDVIAIRGATAFRQRLARSRFENRDRNAGAYRRGGVYVIIGGAGGLGSVLTAYLIERYQAQVVWMGRRPADAAMARKLGEFGAAGPAPLYLSVDATDAAQLSAALAEVSTRFGAIHGLVHSAMGEIDGSVASMDEAQFDASSRPKMDICVRIAQTLAPHAPELMLFFSSINAFARDHGKSGYATANSFEDAFALRLAAQTSATVKVVNWGWWADVGVSQNVPPSAVARMERLGLAGIDAVRAMDDLEAFLCSPLRQLAILAVDGDGQQFVSGEQELRVDFARPWDERLAWRQRADAASPAVPAPAARRQAAAAALPVAVAREAGAESLAEQALAVFVHLLADALKMAPAQIDPHEAMEAYGIDSILIVHMTQILERHLDGVSSTLFFEHRTLHALVDHFIATQPDNVRALLGASASPAPAAAAAHPGPPTASAPPPTAAATATADPTARPGYEPIAIIGMHGRFPLADDLDQFWENLRAGRDCITRVPDDRWGDGWFDPGGVDAAIDSGRSYCDRGGFMAGFADFDAELFGILPNTAHCMDPQERWFLQSCWLAMEDAGYTAESLRRNARVGVYAGVTKTGFELYLPALAAQGETLLPHTSFSSVANQVSYLFDFSGPSLPVDTMCSASLTAIHEACESLHRGACDVAIAGGVNLYLHPHNYVYLCRARMLSGDGRCKSFAAGADGFVPGEGVGTVLLKPLARAEADGDHIRAVIIASNTNHGGKTNGYTVPNPQAQQSLIQEALSRADIDPRSITCIEAHGTGTALGDPIEVRALQLAFAARARESGVSLENWTCAIGSAKSNVGHLEAAAGMAGLAKIVLQLQHRERVPSLHADAPNPAIAFGRDGFFLQRQLTPWEAGTDRHGRAAALRAGLSSFGAGGANAHLIVEEYRAGPAVETSVATSGPALVILSAATDVQLASKAAALRAWIAGRPAEPDLLRRVAYTLQCGRVPMAQRLGVVADSLDELIDGLDDYLGQRPSPRVFRGQTQSDRLSKLLSDDDVDLTISAWLRKGKYRRLVEAWCSGLRVEWRQLYPPEALPRKIALPGYPLARQRYWLPDRLSRASATAAAGRAAATAAAMPAAVPHDLPVSRLFVAQWRDLAEDAAAFRAAAAIPDDHPARRLIWVIDAKRRLSDAALAPVQADHEVWRLPPPSGDLAAAYTALAKQLKAALRDLLGCGRPARLSLLIVTPAPALAAGTGDEDEQAALCYDGLAGLLFSASEEAPQLVTRCVTAAGDLDGAALRRLLCSGDDAASSLHVRQQQGEAQYLSLRELPADTAPAPSFWRPGGVYLITGGFGALGRCLIDDARRREPSATVIVIGRRSPDEVVQGDADSEGRVEYLQADVASAGQLAAAIARVRERHGRLHGVIHCAGQLDDAPLLRAADAQTDTVFAPKVDGLIHLDACTAGFELDFFVAYSSIASLGNPGQADYAAANGFMNQYLRHRRSRVSAGIRHGRSIAINWPLWASDGMQLEAAGERKLRATGMLPLGGEQGVAMLHRILALSGGETGYYVFFGHAARLDPALAARFPNLAAAAANTVAAAVAPRLAPPAHGPTVDRLDERLAELLASHTGLQKSQVDPHRRLEDYGIDSLLIAALNRSLAPHFASLSATLFYQFQTLDAAARHLLATHPQDCARWLALPSAGHSRPAAVPAADPGHMTIDAGRSAPAASAQAPSGRSEQRAKIAIIGLAGRYPGARTLDAFWDNLAAGNESIQTIPPQRWPLHGFYEADVETAVAAGKSYSQWGGFVDGFDEFDYLFFGMAPFDVQCVDPQERLFVECCWHAIENAGYTPATLGSAHAHRVGVFAGITKTGFDLYGPDLWRQDTTLLPYTSFSSVANRISYLFDLRGPSMPVDTMCSSSLTAIHQAVESVRRGECEAAIAGGVNLYLHPSTYVGLCARKMLSADGHCRSFGAGSNGFVPGEGVGAVLLKDLCAALRDGDPVHAVIVGSAVNHGGRTHGFTVPSPVAQAAVIASALGDAGLHAEQIDYVEAHGTGTELGDPIEVTGLTEGFTRAARSLPLPRERCVLGSVKANIGHLEAAAGIAGLTKIVLQMQHGQWLPGLHIAQANPAIAFGQSPFRLQHALAEWPAGADGLRRAGLSSFGAGGANAHLIVESFVPPLRAGTQIGDPCLPGLLLLSADSVEQVRACAAQLYAAARKHVHSPATLADFLYTLQVGRATRAVRAVAGVATPAELLQQLQRISTEIGSSEAGIVWHGVGGTEAIADLAPLQARPGPSLRRDTLLSLQRWLNNEAVDWSPLWRGRDGQPLARRMHLPGYVFRPDRFWIREKLAAPESFLARPAAVAAPRAAAPAPQTLLFTESLQARHLSSDYGPTGKVLYFAVHSGHRQAIASAFARRGDAVAFASPPPDPVLSEESGSESSACRYFSAELSRFAATAGGAFSVVFAWPLERPRHLQDSWLLVELLRSVRLAACVDRLVLAVPHFAQGEPAASNAYAEGWEGLRRSLPTLLPDTAVAVFSQLVADVTDWQSWAQDLHDELSADVLESVRFTTAERLVYETQEVSLEPARPVLRKAGTYLITGGAGGLGRVVAAFLLRAYQAQVVLLGRSPASAVDLSALRAGAHDASRLHYVQADVCDAAALAQAVGFVEQTHARIDGVIHAAGLVSGRGLFDLSPDEFRAVLRPKIEGTLALVDVFREREPDFILYMGSAAALLGDFGTGNYAFANRFMAHCALAAASPARRTRHQTLCWPLWREGAMGRESGARTENFLAASGQAALETPAALALLEHALGAQFGQFMVLCGDPARVRQRAAMAGKSERAAAGASAGPSSTEAAPAQDRSAAPRSLLPLVKRHIAAVIGVPAERIDGAEPFIDLGFDSVHLARLARSISAELAIELSPTELFSHSSARALGRLLSERTVHRPQEPHVDGRDAPRPAPMAGDAAAAGLAGAPAARDATPAAIAIIGISGIFPGARNLDVMWESLRDGIDLVEAVSRDRFEVDAYFDAANGPGKTCSRWLGMVPGEAEFDPLFFELSPLEAEEIDPRQRLLLQESWKALEQAGYGPDACARHTIGVFVGVEQGDYQQVLGTGDGSANALTTNHDAILAARLSYHLDLQGPVLTINTACSSGLVAAHQACQSLRSGECDTALAASAQLLLSPRTLVAMSQAGMLSPTGRCRAFDAQADGIVAGEAVVVLVLKTLEKARADNDPVLAVIAGSGINYDGRTNGITAPSGASQRRLLETVYRNHAIDPANIGYVLAHGTGTRLGDPVEVNALVDAFRAFTPQRGFCALGSTKSNFGHTFAASGLVSVAAMVRALQDKVIAPSLHCSQENELVDWPASPFYVNKSLRPWQQAAAGPRLGAVSAFGMSGTNAHMVIAEAEAVAPQASGHTGPVLLLLSARSKPALERKLADLLDWCRTCDLDHDGLVRLGYTLSVCRHHFRHRFGVKVSSTADAIAQLERAVGGTAREDGGDGRRTVERDFEPDEATLQALNRRLEQAAGAPPEALLPAYLEGYDPDWSRGYGGRRLMPVAAPVYPFSTQRYRVDVRPDEHAASVAAVSAPPDAIWQALADAAGRGPPDVAEALRGAPAFDADFYAGLMRKLADNELSVDDAVRHTHARMTASSIGDASD